MFKVAQFFLECDYGVKDFFFIGASRLKQQKKNYELLNPFPTVKYEMLHRTKGRNSNRSKAEMVYICDSVFKISRPAFVIPVTIASSQSLLFEKGQLESAEFNAVPYAFFDRSGWSDIRRGITMAETELKQGEKLRLLPLLTHSSATRNDILNKVVFKYVDLPANTRIPVAGIRTIAVVDDDGESDEEDEDRYEHGITEGDHERLMEI
jgi:hypothetical protein